MSLVNLIDHINPSNEHNLIEHCVYYDNETFAISHVNGPMCVFFNYKAEITYLTNENTDFLSDIDL